MTAKKRLLFIAGFLATVFTWLELPQCQEYCVLDFLDKKNKLSHKMKASYILILCKKNDLNLLIIIKAKSPSCNCWQKAIDFYFTY